MKTGFNTLVKTPLIAFLCLLTLAQVAHGADDDYSAEGERRAKSAGESLVGTPAPQMQLQTLDGRTLDLAELYGTKPVYIKFWATWCVPCREQMPGFEDIYKQYGDKIQVIAVNTGISDSVKSVTEFSKKMGLTMPITIDDGKLARAFHLRVTPQHLLIDKNGKFAYFGHRDDAEFHQALDKVIAEKASGKPLANPTFVAKDSGYNLGDTVPDLAFSTIDEQPLKFTFNTDGSKKLALVFFGPWCEWYLEKTEPKTSQACTQVRELLEQKSQAASVQWVTVSTNLWSSVAELEDYRKSYGTSMPIVFDKEGDLFKQFGVNQVPSITLIDADGKVSLKSSIQDEDFDAALHAISTLK
ncbi:redoxin domain-containing protein [Shewanella sp. AS16]|uniref:TlpA family protein disulfide reductase n=1 Tax=Shewanella sp. AS16 TaxID=2907625 RepID=UPI001F215029|nr:redoxin domain-containing protein [Shewanella sp. AS16]MCE9687747.1 redoxin domain-containing protein [Shewanella sp. AS16]